jgi:hypothetical protein
MYCSQCSSFLPDQSNFCPKCGAVATVPVTAISDTDKLWKEQTVRELPKPFPARVTPVSRADRLWKTRIWVVVICFVAGILLVPNLQPVAGRISMISLFIFAVGWSISTIQYRHKIAFIIVTLVLIAGVDWFESYRIQQQADERQKHFDQMTPPTETVNNAPANPEQILNDAKKTAREKYVNKMQDEFRNQGVEATISDLDGDMVVVSDSLKLKPNRDRLMRSAFDPTYCKALCAAGFKTVELKSGVVFGDGDTYSLGCPETKEERDARLEARKGQRQAFVDELQRSFNGDSETAALNIWVEQGADELILTGSSANDVPLKMFRSMISAEFGDGTSNKLCSVGFHGLRVKSNSSSSGAFIPFNCGKTSR